MSMESADLLHLRLLSQRLTDVHLSSPTDVVRHLGAVQSQDFNGAMWAVSQRSNQLKTADFLAAFNNGDILRTHVMRPTWHFVAQEDIVWLLDLTRDRLLQSLGYYFKKYDLNEVLFRHTNTIISAHLADGIHATRKEIAAALALQQIDVSDTIRLTHIIFCAEITGVICSGAMRGKEQTYALLSERAPAAAKLDRTDALVELARRYFISHGPATLDDFAWWSGLTKRDAKTGLDAVKNDLQSLTIDGKVYWLSRSIDLVAMPRNSAYFLPNYDEYIVAYENRDGLFDLATKEHLDSRQNPLFNNVLIVDGIAVGTWKKVIKSDVLTIIVTPFRAFTPNEVDAIERAANKFGSHLDLKMSIVEGLD